MLRRLFTLAAILSFLLCLASIALYAKAASTQNRFHIHAHGSVAFYADSTSLGWRQVTSRGTIGWDFTYPSVLLLTLATPGFWLWARLSSTKLNSNPSAPTEAVDHLRNRIRFYLSPILTAGCMIGIAAEAINAPVTAILLVILPLELALIANIIVRRRLKIRLSRLLANQCESCGYSLHANTTGTCPECGASP